MNTRPMPLAEFDQCCGQCLAGVALDSCGAIAAQKLDRVCDNCPLISARSEASSPAPASQDSALQEARAH